MRKHVLEQNFGVAVRRVVVAEQVERAHHFHAGRVERHQNHRLAFVVRPSGSVSPMKIAILQRLSLAPRLC